MPIDYWDLHDVIGHKPPYFYAKHLDDYMMSSYKPPVWMDDDEIEILTKSEVSCCDQGCQTDFPEATLDSKQSAEEGSLLLLACCCWPTAAGLLLLLACCC